MSGRSPSRDRGFGAQGSTVGDGVSHSDVFARRSDVAANQEKNVLRHLNTDRGVASGPSLTKLGTIS